MFGPFLGDQVFIHNKQDVAQKGLKFKEYLRGLPLGSPVVLLATEVCVSKTVQVNTPFPHGHALLDLGSNFYPCHSQEVLALRMPGDQNSNQ